MSQGDRRNIVPPVLGIAWCTVVMATYYLYNFHYYYEKISVFGKFFLGFLG